MRITSRVVGILAALPIVLLLPAFTLGLGLALWNPAPQSRIVLLPNGHEAKVIYNAGFLGRDYTEVVLKRNDCCQHTTVLWHAGPGWFADTNVQLIDNNHLRLTYHSRRDDPQHCESQVGDIKIVCVSSPLSEIEAPGVPPR
jgi:hypothetical protein